MITLRQRLASILEWSAVDKSLVVSGVLLLVLGAYLLGFLYTMHLPHAARLVRLDVVPGMLAALLALAVGALLLFGTGLWLRRRRPRTLWLQYVAVHYYALALVLSSYFIGTLTFAAGIVLLGAPVFGFIFLDRRAVWSATVIATLALLAFSYATAFGWLPYAPLVQPPTDAASNLWWMTTAYLFAAPHFLTIIVLADQMLHFWRNREDTIRTLSLTDPLTGLHNRRSILDLLDKEVARTRRHGPPMCVVLLDLDHFKKINDTWGHPVGDKVLQEAARVLADAIRQCDSVGRYGGEEFMLVLPDTTTEGASVLLERCRAALATTLIRAENGKTFTISASFGMVCNQKNMDVDASLLIKLADEALYRAKENGRNRVETAEAVAA